MEVRKSQSMGIYSQAASSEARPGKADFPFFLENRVGIVWLAIVAKSSG